MIAMLYQHGSVPLDYKKAKLFARRNINKGFEKARWLYAAATDRLLMKQGKKQKYGTQYVRNKGKWSLYPVNLRTTNKERKKYNVPVIKEF